ncbi:MAG: hypothetical protein IJ584_04470 [Bacteroidales bacterium]|nr:hypothetical protein [Bacteroidales bacterium]
MENFQSLREIFSLIRESLQEGSLIHESVILIGAMMCLVAIVGWYARVTSGRSDEGHLPILSTAAIAFAVSFFPSVVLGPLDGITSALSTGITGALENRKSLIDEKVSEAYLRSEEAFSDASLSEEFESMEEESGAEGLPAEDPTFWDKVKGNVLGILSSLSSHGIIGFNLPSNILSSLVGILSTLVRAVLSVVSGMYLLILGEAGPLVFALSILPSFRSGIHSWISKYIQVSFWVPVCSFIEYLGCVAKESVADIFSRGDFYSKLLFPSYQFTIIDRSVIILVMSTPRICSFLTGSASAGVFSRVAERGGRAITRAMR